jgi:NAD(P)-dependent dehydrogenase (short-subunit alcohol dehydrogenase family)
VLGHTEGELHEVASRIRDSGGEAMPLLADVASAEEMGRAMDQLVEAYGRLDIVVANAGINGVWAPIDELAPEEWDRTIAVNLRGTFSRFVSKSESSSSSSELGGDGRRHPVARAHS